MKSIELHNIAKSQNLVEAWNHVMDPESMPDEAASVVEEWQNMDAVAIAWNEAGTEVLVECNDVTVFAKTGAHGEVIEPQRVLDRGLLVIEL